MNGETRKFRNVLTPRQQHHLLLALKTKKTVGSVIVALRLCHVPVVLVRAEKGNSDSSSSLFISAAWGGKKVSYETQGRIVTHTDTHELDSSVNLLVGLSETIPIERSSLVFRSASLRRCYSITTFNLDMMGNILEVALMVWDCDVGTHAIKGMISRHVNI